MEKYILDKDITAFVVTATSFPAGIKAAHEKLHSLLEDVSERHFFGISYPSSAGIIYKAAAEEAYPGEGEKLHCEKFTIRKGLYISERINDWKKDERIVAQTFQQLLAYPGIDQNGYCLEMYPNENDMLCLVTLSAETE